VALGVARVSKALLPGRVEDFSAESVSIAIIRFAPRGYGIESGSSSPLESWLAGRSPSTSRAACGKGVVVHRFRKWCGTRSSTARKVV